MSRGEHGKLEFHGDGLRREREVLLRLYETEEKGVCEKHEADNSSTEKNSRLV